MTRIFLAVVLFIAVPGAASAQPVCPLTPSSGAANTLCANTAFVQRAIGAIFTPVTVAELPASPTVPLAVVSDGTSGLTNGQVVTGGHSTPYLVWWNQTHWTVVGE